MGQSFSYIKQSRLTVRLAMRRLYMDDMIIVVRVGFWFAKSVVHYTTGLKSFILERGGVPDFSWGGLDFLN